MVFSQTKNEQEKVVKSYNTTKISVLKNKLKNQKNQRNKAINEFIIKNPNVKKTIRYEDGTVKEIKYMYATTGSETIIQ